MSSMLKSLSSRHQGAYMTCWIYHVSASHWHTWLTLFNGSGFTVDNTHKFLLDWGVQHPFHLLDSIIVTAEQKFKQIKLWSAWSLTTLALMMCLTQIPSGVQYMNCHDKDQKVPPLGVCGRSIKDFIYVWQKSRYRPHETWRGSEGP